MEQLHITLFGKFQIACNQRLLDGVDVSKVQELLCFLLLFREKHHSREMLANLLWGDQPSAQARRYLSKALWQLQTALAESDDENKGLISIDSEWIGVNPEAEFWLDVCEFEQVCARVREYYGWELTSEQAADLSHAVELYQGDLLEGWFQEWCLIERERLQMLYINILEKLMRCCEAKGMFEAGQDYGYRILRYDRAHESTHRLLMRLLYLAGNRTGALRQYQRCCQILKEELDVEPTQRTQALYEQVCNDQLVENNFPRERLFTLSPSGRHQHLLAQVHALRIGLEEFEQRLKSSLSGAETTDS